MQVVNEFLKPRMVGQTLSERLSVMPAVVVTGARQTGKSTLVRDLLSGERSYYTLDDLDIVDLARRDPESLVASADPVTIDEVQREPGLLLAVKRAIDDERRAGRFLLTGSANLLLMHRVSESLAGRASYLTLWPMTRREQLGIGRCGIWEELLAARDDDWPEIVARQTVEAEDWRSLAQRGGFPTPALQLENDAQRQVWFDGYVRTYLERDLQSLSAISGLPDFRRLMQAACLRLGQVVNQTELGRDVALPQPTVHRYLNLLETSHMLTRLAAYSVNRTKRLIKSPKLYWSDTGLALHLASAERTNGAHLENLVHHDLAAWRDGRVGRVEVLYWRTTTGEEVDFVIETPGELLPIEVTSTTRPSAKDARHLRTFKSEYGGSARSGLLLHTGETVEWLPGGVLAAPWWKVL